MQRMEPANLFKFWGIIPRNTEQVFKRGACFTRTQDPRNQIKWLPDKSAKDSSAGGLDSLYMLCYCMAGVVAKGKRRDGPERANPQNKVKVPH